MPKDNSQQESAGPQPHRLTEEDEKAITGAIVRAIERLSKPETPKSRFARWMPWLIVFIVFVMVAGLGGFAFLVRTPQNATFTGTFDTDTQLVIQVPNDKTHRIKGGTVQGLKLYSIGRPLRLELPMEPEERALLTQALDSQWMGKPIIKDYLSFELNFTEPVEVNIKVGQSDEVSIRRKLATTGEGIFMQTSVSQLQPPAEGEPSIVVIVNPGKANFSIKKSDQEVPGQFSLRSAPTSNSSEPSPYFIMYLDRASETIEEMSSEIWLEYEPEVDCTANIYGSAIDAKYTSEGVLTMGSVSGSVTYKPSKGERLRLIFDRIQLVNITDNRIYVEDAHVSSVLLNSVVELLPRVFTTWPDWARSLWAAFAFSTGVPTLLLILRRINLWPS